MWTAAYCEEQVRSNAVLVKAAGIICAMSRRCDQPPLLTRCRLRYCSLFPCSAEADQRVCVAWTRPCRRPRKRASRNFWMRSGASSGPNITAAEPRTATAIGSADSSFLTTSGIHGTWARRRLQGFYPILPMSAMLPLQPRMIRSHRSLTLCAVSKLTVRLAPPSALGSGVECVAFDSFGGRLSRPSA